MDKLLTKYLLVGLCLLISVSTINTTRADFGTNEVAQASISTACLDYCIVGVCFKLLCTIFGCTVKTYPLISHRLPDLVVSVYNNPGEISWIEARDILGSTVLEGVFDIVGGLLDMDHINGGYKQTTGQHGDDEDHQLKTNNMKYKEVSVIGNPILEVFDSLSSGSQFFCDSEVEPFRPYFQSELDAITWRLGIAELLYWESWTPGAREIGTVIPPQSWGSVHPRTGWLLQEYDTLAAAVFAQRAVDVVTRSNQPHIYSRVPGIESSNEKTDQWNMISPILEPNYCTSFGLDFNYWMNREHPNEEEGYGWIYWGLHECCTGPNLPIVGKAYFDPICFETEADIETPEEEEDDSNIKPTDEREQFGKDGEVWKPVSEGDGNLVILTPSSNANVTISLYDSEGNFIEQGDYVGRTNGNRPTYRFNRPGSDYPSPLIVKVGTTQSQVNNPGTRTRIN